MRALEIAAAGGHNAASLTVSVAPRVAVLRNSLQLVSQSSTFAPAFGAIATACGDGDLQRQPRAGFVTPRR